MPSLLLDEYRPPAEAPPKPDRGGSSAASLLLIHVALVPLAVNMIAFTLPFVLGPARQSIPRTQDVLPWLGLLAVVGAAAAWLGVARLGQRVSRPLPIAAVALVLSTTISVLLGLLEVAPALHVAWTVRKLLAEPVFIVLLVLSCRRILGVTAHPWLVRMSAAGTVAAVGLDVVGGMDLYGPGPISTPSGAAIAVVITSMAIHVAAWMASSLLLWRLRGFLRAPASFATS